MDKKGKVGWALIVSIVLVIVLIVVLFYYFVIFNQNHESAYDEKIKTGEISNPMDGKTVEQAVLSFNESFIYYVLVQIKAYNLHNPPLSGEKPLIEFYVGQDVYNAIVDGGAIVVSRGQAGSPDIRIKTTREEAVKMTQNKEYIQESFSSGRSSFEQVAGAVTLASKGYVGLYKELTGKSITGNVIKVYAG